MENDDIVDTDIEMETNDVVEYSTEIKNSQLNNEGIEIWLSSILKTLN